MFSTIFSFFLLSLDYVENFLGLLDLGIFEKGVGNLNFGQIFFNFLIGLCPFGLFLTVLAPCGNFNMYLGRFIHVHALPTCYV